MARSITIVLIIAICAAYFVNQSSAQYPFNFGPPVKATCQTYFRNYWDSTDTCLNCKNDYKCHCEWNLKPCLEYKKLLTTGVYGTWGPRVTKCNDCMKDYPIISESCFSYGKWTRVQECAKEEKAGRDGNGEYKCNAMELAQVAGACLVRNTLSSIGGSLGCMSEDHCTEILKSSRMNGVTKPSFSGGSDDYPTCGLTVNWFFDPPACADKISHDKLDQCLLKDLDHTKMNEVAKGYLRAWYEEYRGRVCGAEHFLNSGIGHVRSTKRIQQLAPTWDKISELLHPEDDVLVKEVEGLNF